MEQLHSCSDMRLSIASRVSGQRELSTKGICTTNKRQLMRFVCRIANHEVGEKLSAENAYFFGRLSIKLRGVIQFKIYPIDHDTCYHHEMELLLTCDIQVLSTKLTHHLYYPYFINPVGRLTQNRGSSGAGRLLKLDSKNPACLHNVLPLV